MGMSDEDFLNANLSDFDLEPVEAPEGEEAEVLDESVEEDVNSAEDAVEDESEHETEETETTDDTEEEDDTASDEDSDETEESDDDEVEEEKESSDTDIDYESFYKALAQPLKVAGNEVVIDDPAQMRRLMSMGADYNLKMQALKPVRKVVKMLENNGLMDESKLSYLIDLSKHSPEAISKLVKESGLDVLSLDTEEDKYTPSNYAVSDNAVELDDVIDRIQSTPTFSDTMDIAAKMDDASKSTLAKNPAALELLNEHVSNGIYAMVQKRIAKERVLGTLGNLSDLDAYQKVGNMLAQEGAFNEPTDKKIVSSKPKLDAKSDERKDKRQKASPTKSSKKLPKPEYNFLEMSDDDFESQFS